MAHFAKLNENNIVEQVLVIEQDVINTGLFGEPSRFVQTSYNTRGGIHYGDDGQPDDGVPLRKNYAGIGFIYDQQRDAFYTPKPYPSWILNEESCVWESPTPMPDDGNTYSWNEETQAWDVVTQE